MQFFRSIGRAIRAVLTAMAILFSSAALAGTPTLTFVDGWVGEYASNANQPTRMYAFDNGSVDLNIKSVTISQNSSTAQFEIPGGQGNDVPVDITVNFVNGTRQTVQGSVNWKIGTNQNPDAIGLISIHRQLMATRSPLDVVKLIF